MKSPTKLVSVLITVFVIASLVLACGGGTTTPTTAPPTTAPPTTTPPTTTPPTTTPPTTTPPTTTPPQTYSYNATIFGDSVTIPADSRGAMLEAFEKTSADGNVTIKFEKGTKITNADLVPYWQGISVTINPSPTQPADGPTLVGPVVTFAPRDAHIFPVMSYQFKYDSFQSQIDQVANAEISLGFQLSNGNWASYGVASQLDTATKTASVSVELFVPIAFLAQTPTVVITPTGVPGNGVDATIVTMTGFSPGGDSTLTINTVPGARVILWLVLPNTGTRSTRPSDRLKGADANGNVTWEWNTHSDTATGEGRIEIYITTSTDPAVIAAFNSYATAGSTALETLFPDKAADIAKFKKGEISQLELDGNTTLKMFPVTYQ